MAIVIFRILCYDNKMKLPSSFKKYFWDIDFEKLNFRKYPVYVSERILEHGNVQAIKWLFRNISKKELIKTILKTRQLSPRSANYWALILDIPKNQILCLKKSYLKQRKSHWPY